MPKARMNPTARPLKEDMMQANAIRHRDAVIDPYPTRVAREAQLLTRQEPTIYGDATSANKTGLSRAQLEHYEQHGYVHLENYFTPREVALMLETANKLAADSSVDARYVIREPQSQTVRSVFAAHRLHPLFAALMQDRRLLTIAQYILGSEVYVHQSRVNFKPGFRGKEFYWHSDYETWHSEDGMPAMRAFSCSIALTDNSPHNGPLMVMPGSHRTFVSCVGETPENHYEKSLRKQEYGVPDDASLTTLANAHGIDAPYGKAGSVTLFDCNTMHGSNSNITPFARTNVFMVYNSVENKLVAPYGGTTPRPEHIGAREHTPTLVPETPDYMALSRK